MGYRKDGDAKRCRIEVYERPLRLGGAMDVDMGGQSFIKCLRRPVVGQDSRRYLTDIQKRERRLEPLVSGIPARGIRRLTMVSPALAIIVLARSSFPRPCSRASIASCRCPAFARDKLAHLHTLSYVEYSRALVSSFFALRYSLLARSTAFL